MIFHHLFECALSDLGNHVLSLGAFSVEFEEAGQFCFMSVLFWKEDTLCKVKLCRFGLTVTYPTGYMGLLSRLLSAITTRPNLLGCSGCPNDVFRAIDKSPHFDRGIQYPFRFTDIDLARLMHRQQYSVFGRIDFFSVLEHLILSLAGCLTERWTHDAPELVKVRLMFSTF